MSRLTTRATFSTVCIQRNSHDTLLLHPVLLLSVVIVTLPIQSIFEEVFSHWT